MKRRTRRNVVDKKSRKVNFNSVQVLISTNTIFFWRLHVCIPKIWIVFKKSNKLILCVKRSGFFDVVVIKKNIGDNIANDVFRHVADVERDGDDFLRDAESHQPAVDHVVLARDPAEVWPDVR